MEYAENALLKYIINMENGKYSITNYTKSSQKIFLKFAVEHGRTRFIQMLMDLYGIPSEGLDLKQRVSTFMLLEGYEQ